MGKPFFKIAPHLSIVTEELRGIYKEVAEIKDRMILSPLPVIPGTAGYKIGERFMDVLLPILNCRSYNLFLKLFHLL